MRTPDFIIAITVALMPAPALAFDEDEFCAAVTDVTGRMNARRGKWLDRNTRHDGVEVDCAAKTLEAKRFLNTEPDAMREGWEGRKQRQWNATYCNHPSPKTWKTRTAGASSRRSRFARASKCRLSWSAKRHHLLGPPAAKIGVRWLSLRLLRSVRGTFSPSRSATWGLPYSES